MTVIGVVALQGAFAEHQTALARLGVDTVQLRKAADLTQPLDGIVLPGGESTVMGKLMNDLGMMAPLQKRVRYGLPVLGTCAGLILLADKVDGGPGPWLSTMPIAVRRNAYGRQLGSFSAEAAFTGRQIPMEFIRAPYIEQVGPGTKELATVNGHTVAAEYGNQLAVAFHPELTDDPTVYRHFLAKVDRTV